jgi:2-iminobutanoate/2-iminopropanoate deaminase
MSEKTMGPYAPAIRCGGFVITSGQIGIVAGASGPVLVEGGFDAQFRQAFSNLTQVLSDQGMSPKDVVKATVYLVDVSDFGRMNELWLEGFGDHRPTRTTVVVAALPAGSHVEIEAWAYKEP